MGKALAFLLAMCLLAGAIVVLDQRPTAPTPKGAPGRLVTVFSAVTTDTTGSAVPMLGSESAVAYLSVAGTATVVVAGTVDGSTYVNLAVADLNSTTRARATSFTASKLLLVDAAGGLSAIRPSISGCSGCTVTLKVRTY